MGLTSSTFLGVCWLGASYSKGGNAVPSEHCTPGAPGPGPPTCLAESRSLNILDLRFSGFNLLNRTVLAAELGVEMGCVVFKVLERISL